MPDDIPGLSLWLKADALVQADNSNVNTWAASAGPDAVAMSGSGFVAPKLRTDQISGLPAVQFSKGAKELLRSADVFGGTTVGDATIVALYMVDSNSEAGRPVGFGSLTGDGLTNRSHWNLAPEPSLRFDGTAITGGYVQSHPTNQFLLRTSIKSGQTFTEYFDGSLALPGTTVGPALTVVDDFDLGDLHFNAQPPGVTNAHVAEVLVYDHALGATERQQVESYVQTKYYGPTRGLWRFENGTAGQPDPGTAGNVLDASVFAENGTAHGTGALPVYSTSVPVRTGGMAGPDALSLDLEFADRNYVEVPHNEAISFGDSAFTLEAWVKLETLGSNSVAGRQYALIKKEITGVSDSQMDYALLAAAGNINAARPRAIALQLGKGTGGSSNTFVFSNLEINDNEWHYLSAAFDPGADLVRFVLDGAVDFKTTAFTPGENLGPLVIGAHFNAGATIDAGFDGLIDEIRISRGFLPLAALQNVVPEPSAFVLAGLALLGLAGVGRRRRRPGAG